MSGNNFILGAIYGPNNHDANFFLQLKTAITSLGNFPVILGGDWNCTFSRVGCLSNPDCLNMAALPNKQHSDYLNTLCAELDMVDPFREFRVYLHTP